MAITVMDVDNVRASHMFDLRMSLLLHNSHTTCLTYVCRHAPADADVLLVPWL
jgi:hypothetical protein